MSQSFLRPNFVELYWIALTILKRSCLKINWVPWNIPHDQVLPVLRVVRNIQSHCWWYYLWSYCIIAFGNESDQNKLHYICDATSGKGQVVPQPASLIICKLKILFSYYWLAVVSGPDRF